MKRSLWLACALVMMVAVMCFATACAKEAVQAQADQMERQTPPDGAVGAVGQNGQDERLRTAPAAGTKLDLDNIQFDFDSAALSPLAQQILVSKSEYMRGNPQIVLTIEGHCDDRGTAAYNMALGDRRAKSVRDFLVHMGVGANRLNTISDGKEKPLAPGQNEASWAKNRRAQFVVN